MTYEINIKRLGRFEWLWWVTDRQGLTGFTMTRRGAISNATEAVCYRNTNPVETFTVEVP